MILSSINVMIFSIVIINKTEDITSTKQVSCDHFIMNHIIYIIEIDSLILSAVHNIT